MLIETKDSTAASYNKFIVTKIRLLAENTFALRFTRGGLKFSAGQHIIAGMKGEMDQREYSIYSGENDDYLEILVREVRDGKVSAMLRECKPGQPLDINGPFGTFGIEPYNLYSRRHIFIATGTGIAPFHSIIRSVPRIDYTLLHGVRFNSEAYDREEYDDSRYILCVSEEKTSDHKGRVTSFLSKFRVARDMLFYLCGNGSMIYEVSHILRDKGITAENIISERYF